MKTLILPLKREYFDQIKAGTKLEEYRLCTEFWRRRLEGKSFDTITLMLGYPASTNDARRMVKPFLGWQIKEILHPHFGEKPVTVYAIDVSGANRE